MPLDRAEGREMTDFVEKVLERPILGAPHRKMLISLAL
jgi:hypothetical protein